MNSEPLTFPLEGTSVLLPSSPYPPTASRIGLVPAVISEGPEGGAWDCVLKRVYHRCHGSIVNACRLSSVPPEFLAALTVLESGGDPNLIRFEPGVYRHLQAVANGESPAYSTVAPGAFGTESEERLHPKAVEVHTLHLTADFSARHGEQLAGMDDRALRELASSWGCTQIMGYHMLVRRGAVRDLLDPAFHYHVALQLLAEYAFDYQLDVTCEFEELFRCWNTGRPYSSTADPDYADRGLELMELYRRFWHEEPGLAESEFQNRDGSPNRATRRQGS